MAQRPNFIDLRSASSGPIYSGLVSPRGLPSPRLHVAGDVPPELSPLDAFAAQSRLLARQLKKQDRESRLPPSTITRALSVSRPGYLRSASADESAIPSTRPDVEVPDLRPMSVHPELGNILRDSRDYDQLPNNAIPILTAPEITFPFHIQDEQGPRGRRPEPLTEYGARKEQSPSPLEGFRFQSQELSPTSYFPTSSASSNQRAQPHLEISTNTGFFNGAPPSQRSRPSDGPVRSHSGSRREEHGGGGPINGHYHRTLAPPRSPYAQKSPSIRSASFDSQDDYPPSAGGPRSRKLSASSGISSPTSPFAQKVGRSPSISSQYSVASLTRPSFNFSRPISRASNVACDLPLRQASSDSQPSFVFADDTVHTPVSMRGEDVNNADGEAAHSSFTLPRGKALQRDSEIIGESLSVEFSTTILDADHTQSHAASDRSDHAIGPPSDTPRASEENEREPKDKHVRIQPEPAPSVSDASTIKASTPTVDESSAEFHVAKGIECHENGSLNESTYHLRIAARQDHPTGMLLYALACRHGWGMRANQKEGVHWLRKAADFAIMEVADDTDASKKGSTIDFMEQKTRKAQFALSVYELGVSHMNGWGIEQDKVLALRCFEIAGAWGDTDALSEAGFCYAQGVGCKKDLKKSARFYRMAEAKGVSMVGNSWIHKSKYRDDDDNVSIATSASKKRDKSKSRLFGRKK